MLSTAQRATLKVGSLWVDRLESSEDEFHGEVNYPAAITRRRCGARGGSLTMVPNVPHCLHR